MGPRWWLRGNIKADEAPELRGWPEPRAASDRHKELVKTWMIWHARMRQDPRKQIRGTMKCVHFICRYAHQSRNEVMNWPVREVQEMMKDLNEFIAAESPKPKGSPRA